MAKSALSLFALLGLVFTTSAASAQYLVEPYFGYESGTVNSHAKITGSDTGGSTTALDAGFRLGYKLPVMFWFAADYSLTTSGKFKPSGGDSDFKGSNLFADVGIDLPILLRFWLGYGLLNERTFDGNGSSSTVKGGTNMKLGVGFTLLPLVSLNLEYLTLKPSDMDSGLKDYDSSAVLFSASLPLDF